jgi:hypothetical protein
MIFKKLIDSDPVQRPLTLSVEISKVADKIKLLLGKSIKKKYEYLANKEEIEFQGIRFREVNRTKIERFRQLQVVNIGAEGHDIGAEGHDIGAEGHDIGAEGHDIGAEGHDIGAEGHDIGGLIIDRYSFGIEIVSVSEYSPYSNLRKHLKGNNLLLVKSMNAKTIKSLVHLLKAIDGIDPEDTFDLMVDILNTSGAIDGRYFGHKDKEIIHEIFGHFDHVWEESREMVSKATREELVYIGDMLKEISLIIYANDNLQMSKLNRLTRDVILLARKVKFINKDLRSKWRSFRTSLFKLKGRNNGVRNEYL